jgi:sugar phosphate isomerase/epimerase
LSLGICSWAFHGFALGRRGYEEIAAAAVEAGFDSLEASYARRRPGPPTASLAAPLASLATLELHRLQLTDPRPAQSREALAVIREMVAFAVAAAIPSVSFSPGRLWPDADLEGLLDAVAHVLEPVLGEAAQQGVVIALENLPGHLLATRAAMTRMLRRLPGASVCLDLGNTLMCPPVESWIDSFGPAIAKAHISDGEIVNGEFQGRPPGQGLLDWPAASRAVQLLGPVPLFVEAAPAETGEPAYLRALRHTAAALVGR